MGNTFDHATAATASSGSTLVLDYTNLMEEIGHYLGYPGDLADFSDDEQADCTAALDGGYRQFLYPPLLPGRPKAHVWAFLNPMTTVDTVSGTVDYTLPIDFGSMKGLISIDSTSLYPPLVERSEGQLRHLRTTTSATGHPVLFAVRVKSNDGSGVQRWELMIYPEPDGVYTLQYRYNVLTDTIRSGEPYPLGGMEHAEALLESCLAVAELRKNDEKGVHWDRFMERLAASISADLEQVPDGLGYNADGSGGKGGSRVRALYSEYEGTIYGDFAP